VSSLRERLMSNEEYRRRDREALATMEREGVSFDDAWARTFETKEKEKTLTANRWIHEFTSIAADISSTI
jgi:hypothetical protein